MKISKLLQIVAVASLAALGAAQAQTPVGAGSFNIPTDGSAATVGQTINLSIPKRFGLHLHRNSWTLDLTNLDANGYVNGNTTGDANCWRAGNHSSGLGNTGTGRDTLYGVKVRNNNNAFDSFYSIPVMATPGERDAAMIGVLWNTVFQGDQRVDPNNPYSAPARLEWGNMSLGTVPDLRIQVGALKQPIGGYPGFYVNASGKLEWKGPIMCTFQTMVEKFSNNNGWLFSGSLAGSGASGFPFPLYISDIFNFKDPDFPGNNGAANNLGPGAGGVALRTDNISRRLARNTTATTGGWKDDHLLEVLVFDGSVAAGTYTGVVTFTLTDYSLPADSNGL